MSDSFPTWRTLSHIGTSTANHTGTTAETALRTIAIPAGYIGANGILRVWSLWDVANSGNNKTLRIRLGGLAGTAFMTTVLTTADIHADLRMIFNRANAALQIGPPLTLAGGLGSLDSTIATGSVNTAVAVDLVFSAELANSGDTARLNAYSVEVLRR